METGDTLPLDLDMRSVTVQWRLAFVATVG
uniref:Uncharacterized protein n=1 Tax=Rhizophora mucronata TaxID=61149 RepID=A0A2P2N3L7_RHIMU